jgi:hypothetical protein
MVGIDIPHNNWIWVREAENWAEIRFVKNRTGGGRRKINIEDVDRGIVNSDWNSQKLNDIIALGQNSGINGSEPHRVVDEDGHPAAISYRTLLPQESVTREARTFGGGREAGLLKAGNLDLMLMKEIVQFSQGVPDPITIEL